MPRISAPGHYKARMVDVQLIESQDPDSKALGFNIKYASEEVAVPGVNEAGETLSVWEKCGTPTDPATIFDKVWFIGKAGTPNEFAVKQLGEIFQWDGVMDEVSLANFGNHDCMLNVEMEPGYNDPTKEHATIAFTNPPDFDPDAAPVIRGAASSETANRAETQYGSTIRAMLNRTVPPPGDPASGPSADSSGSPF